SSIVIPLRNVTFFPYTTLFRSKDAVFFKDKHQTGDILGVLSDDIDHIQNLYLRTIFPTIVGWLLYVVIVLALGYFSWFFTLVMLDRKSTRLNSSHVSISYAVFC